MADRSYSGLSVIIVDDVRATRAILKAILRTIGIQDVIEADDGTEALEKIKGRRMDLVITDLSMAPMNGIELTRRLRRPKNLNAFVPVLMISAYSEKTRISEAIAAGVSAFLLKPVTPTSLTKKVQALIERPIPVVLAESYHGPDRRRRTIKVRKERRSTSIAPKSEK